MSASKSISESTEAELIERKQKHEFVIKLIDSELSSRKSGSKVEKSASFNPLKVSFAPNVKDNTNSKTIKRGGSQLNLSTKEDMKHILTENKIEYKTSMKKDELIVLIKKHNLIRAVENYTSNSK